jgi:hypothetical protein
LNLYQVFELPGSEPQRGFQRPKVEVHCCSSSGKETTKVGGLGTGSNSFGRTLQGHRADSFTYGRVDGYRPLLRVNSTNPWNLLSRNDGGVEAATGP